MSRWGPPKVTPKRPRTPQSDSKTNLNSTVTPGYLNSTRSSAHSRHNMTLLNCSRNLLQDNAIIQRETMDLECNLVYNNYLQFLVKLDILRKAIEDRKIEYNDQLETQREQLSTFTDQYKDLEKVLKEKQIYLSFVEISVRLFKYFEELRGILTDDIKRTIEKFKEELEIESEKIRLINVQSFKSQEDFDLFEKFIKDSRLVLAKYKSKMGDVDGIEKLLDCLKANLEISVDVSNKNKVLEVAQNFSINDTLEKASDLLTNVIVNI